MVHRPIPLGTHPPSVTPSLVMACPLFTLFLRLPAPPRDCCSLSLSVALLSVWPPACLSFHLPATPPVNSPPVHLASQPPVTQHHLSSSFRPSVPDQQLIQLLTLFVPAHAISGLREGDKVDMGRGTL